MDRVTAWRLLVVVVASGYFCDAQQLPLTAQQQAAFPTLSLAQYHACATLTNGTFFCWGGRGDQLSYPGTNFHVLVSGTSTSDKPPSLGGGAGVGNFAAVGISTGFAPDGLSNGQKFTNWENNAKGTTIVLMSNGSYVAYGDCGVGQCGSGSIASAKAGTTAVLTTIDTREKVVQVAAGYTHSCFVLSSGIARCTGGGASGQLGHFATLHSSSYYSVPGPPVDTSVIQLDSPYNNWSLRIVQIAVGTSFTCALLNTGNVTCFGSNSNLQTGVAGVDALAGPVSAISFPGRIPALQVCSGDAFACALLVNNTAACWGLDPATTSTNKLSPFTLPAAGQVVQVSCGRRHACMLLDSGSVRCGGLNDFSQSDVSSTTNPMRFESASTITVSGESGAQLAMGPSSLSTCLLTKSGNIHCWGMNIPLGAGKYNNGQGAKPNTALDAIPAFITAPQIIRAGSTHLPWPVVQAIVGAPPQLLPPGANSSYTGLVLIVWVPPMLVSSPLRAFLGPVACTNTTRINATAVFCGLDDQTLRSVRDIHGLPAPASVSVTDAPTGTMYSVWVCPRPVLESMSLTGLDTINPGTIAIRGSCLRSLAPSWLADPTPTVTALQGTSSVTVTGVNVTHVIVTLRKGIGTQEVSVRSTGTLVDTSLPSSVFVTFANAVLTSFMTSTGSTSALNISGEWLTINGRYFGDPTLVPAVNPSISFGDLPCASVVHVSDAQISCFTPNVTQSPLRTNIPITVLVQGRRTNALVVRFIEPLISSVSPTFMFAATSATVWIRGSGFGTSMSTLIDLTIAGYSCPRAKLIWSNSSALACSNVSANSLVNRNSGVQLTVTGWPSVTVPFAYFPAARIAAITPPLEAVGSYVAFEGANLGFTTDFLAIGGVHSVGLRELGNATSTIDCTSSRVSAANLGSVVLCQVPNGDSNKTYTPYVQLTGGPLVANDSATFRFKKVSTLAVSWHASTLDLQSSALPSSVDYLITIKPALAVQVKTATGSNPTEAVVCMLQLDNGNLPASPVQVFVSGNSTIAAKTVGPDVIANFSAVGIIGGSGLDYPVYAQCSFGGAGPWYASSKIRIRVPAILLSWNVHVNNGTMPSAEPTQTDPGLVVPIQPAPMVSLRQRLAGIESAIAVPAGISVSCALGLASLTASSMYAVGSTTVFALVNGSAVFNNIGVVGPLKSQFIITISCTWPTGETILATSFAARTANLIMRFEAVAPFGSLPPSMFIYNTPTANVSSALYWVSAAGTETALSSQPGITLRTNDLSCTLSASSNLATVTFTGGQFSSLDPARGSTMFSAISLQPSFATLPQPIAVVVSQACRFRGQALPIVQFATTMQNLSLAWVQVPPSTITSSTSTVLYPLPDIVVRLQNQTGQAISSDSTTSCVFSVTAALSRDGQQLSKQAVTLDGISSVLVRNGIANFSRCSITAPLGATVTLQTMCTRAEGGPSMIMYANTSVQAAEVKWNTTQGIDNVTVVPALLYDAPVNMTLSVSILSPLQKDSFKPYSTLPYSRYYPATTCTLSIDASVDAAAQATLRGDTRLFRAVAVDSIGSISFVVRLTGAVGVPIPLKASCTYGDTALSTGLLFVTIVGVQATWQGTASPWFIYNSPSAAPAIRFQVDIPANSSVGRVAAKLPLETVTTLTNADVSCQLESTTDLEGLNVPFLGGTFSALNTSTSTVALSAVSLLPNLLFVAQPVLVNIEAMCKFRALPMDVLAFQTTMQNLSLAWIAPPPVSVSSSAGGEIFRGPPLVLAILNQTGQVLTSDYTTSCTVNLDRAIGKNGQILARQQVLLDGNLVATAVGGIVNISTWYVSAPLRSSIRILLTCNRAEGGPTLSLSGTFATNAAEVAWSNASNIDSTGGLPVPAVLWDMPASVWLRVWEQVPTTADNTSAYTIRQYSRASSPATYCSLAVDGSSSGAILSGDATLYTGVAVDDTGSAQLQYRLMARPGVLVSFRIACQYGDSVITAAAAVSVMVMPLSLTWLIAPQTTPFIFNVPTSEFAVQVVMDLSANVSANFSQKRLMMPQSVLASLSTSDIACAVDATMADGATIRAVPFTGGSGVVNASNASFSFSAMSYSPSTASAYVQVHTLTKCSFRGLALNDLQFYLGMQNLTLSWVTRLPAGIVTSTQSSIFRAPLTALRLLDNFGTVIEDSTASCSLGVGRAISSDGADIPPQQILLGGNTIVSSINGSVTFNDWYVIAPVGTGLTFKVDCNRVEGGPTISQGDTTTVISAELRVIGTDSLDPTQNIISHFYDAPMSVVAAVYLRNPIDKANSSAYVVSPFNSTLVPATQCSLGFDAVLLGQLGISAVIAGDSQLFQSVAVNGTGHVTLKAKLQAIAGVLVPLRVTCLFGEATLVSDVISVQVTKMRGQVLQPLPALVLPSTAEAAIPLSSEPLSIAIVDDFGNPVVDDAALHCSIASQVVGYQDATVGDVYQPDQYAVALLSGSGAAGVLAPQGVANFSELLLTAPLGSIVNITVTCSRSSGGELATVAQTVHVSWVSIGWKTDSLPPARVLYNTPYGVAVQAFVQRSISRPWQWEAYNASQYYEAQCNMLLAEEDTAKEIALGGSAKGQSARLNERGEAEFILVLQGAGLLAGHVSVACSVLGSTVRTTEVPSIIEVLVASFDVAPVTQYFPSTGSAKWAVNPAPLVRITNKDGVPVESYGISCRVSVNATQVRPSDWPNGYLPRILDAPEEGYLYNHAIGGMLLDTIYPSAWWGTTLPLYVLCTRPEGDAIPPIPWNLRMVVAAPRWFEPPPQTVEPSAPFQMSLQIWDDEGNQPILGDNTTTCIITAGDLTVQRARSTAYTGVVEFSGVIVLGMPAQQIVIQLRCLAGDMPFIAMETAVIQIAGCQSGWQPVGIGLSSCGKCPDGQFSDGGAMFCRKCPFGVKCTDGILQPLPGYYLAIPPDANPAQYGVNVTSSGSLVAVQVTEATELHPCWNDVACIVNATERSYACAEGYSGVLCGVCVQSQGWVQSGNRCAKCAAASTNKLVLALIVIFTALVLLYLSLFMDFGVDSAAKTVWRILVNFISALGAFTVYKAHGPDEFAEGVSAFQSVVVPGSGSGLQIAPVQCELQLNFYTRFIAVITFPLVAALLCMAINVLYIVIYSCGKGAKATASEVAGFWATKRQIAVAAIVMFMAYPSLTTQAFSMFNCKPERIAGVSYLEQDLSVSCDSTTHALASTLSWVVVGLLCGGLPALFAWFLYKNERVVKQGVRTQFFSTFGFLYQGYRTDKWYYYSWEALIMVRKAFIVAVAATAKDAVYQFAALQLLLVTCFALQLHIAPFAKPLFNYLEAMTLLALILTQAVCFMYLRAASLDSSIASETTNAAVAKEQQAVLEASPGMLTDVATTVILFLINALTIAVLVFNYVRIRRAELAQSRTCYEWMLDWLGVYRRRPNLMLMDVEREIKTFKVGKGKSSLTVSRTTANPLADTSSLIPKVALKAIPKPPPKPQRLQSEQGIFGLPVEEQAKQAPSSHKSLGKARKSGLFLKNANGGLISPLASVTSTSAAMATSANPLRNLLPSGGLKKSRVMQSALGDNRAEETAWTDNPFMSSPNAVPHGRKPVLYTSRTPMAPKNKPLSLPTAFNASKALEGSRPPPPPPKAHTDSAGSRPQSASNNAKQRETFDVKPVRSLKIPPGSSSSSDDEIARRLSSSSINSEALAAPDPPVQTAQTVQLPIPLPPPPLPPISAGTATTPDVVRLLPPPPAYVPVSGDAVIAGVDTRTAPPPAYRPWKELWDAKRKRKYYANIATGTKQWEKPADFALNGEPYAPVWRCEYDASTSLLSYVNTVSGEVRSDKPDDFDGAAVEDHWEEHASAKHEGKPYFYNTLTRAKTWERPPGFKPSS